MSQPKNRKNLNAFMAKTCLLCVCVLLREPKQEHASTLLLLLLYWIRGWLLREIGSAVLFSLFLTSEKRTRILALLTKNLLTFVFLTTKWTSIRDLKKRKTKTKVADLHFTLSAILL